MKAKWMKWGLLNVCWLKNQPSKPTGLGIIKTQEIIKSPVKKKTDFCLLRTAVAHRSL